MTEWKVKMNRKYTTKYISLIGLLSAFAIIISYIESLIPIDIGIPGVKLGLANIVIVLSIYLLDAKSAIIINIIRIIIIGAFFGNVFSIIFSITGALFSFIVMIILKRIKNGSIMGVSVCGGVSHNLSQLVVASFIVNTYNINYYLPFMIIGGIITGILIGTLSMIIYNRIRKIHLN